MPDDKRHLTDRELILEADDELQSPQARAHLEACRSCQARQADLQTPVPRTSASTATTSIPNYPPATARARPCGQSSKRPAIAALAAACIALVMLSMGSRHLRAGRLSRSKTILTPGETRSVDLTDPARPPHPTAPAAIHPAGRSSAHREHDQGDAGSREGGYGGPFELCPQGRARAVGRGSWGSRWSR